MALVLRLDRDDDGLALYAGGWCLSGTPVRSVQISSGNVARRLPIWRPRPDVQNAVNRDNMYPPLHALCSGIEGVVRLPDTQGDEIEVRIDVVAVDGSLLPARAVALTVGETVDLA
jgi:hypothetical protein